MAREDKYRIGKDIAENLGLYPTFFHMMRRDNPDKLKYIQSFSNDMLKAYPMYLEHKEKIKNKACEIYYLLEEKQELIKYGKFLVNKKIYKNEQSYYKTDETIFSVEGIQRFPALVNIEKSNNAFKEYMDITK